MEALRAYHWPGNVRELENLVRRLAVLYSQETIDRDVIENELNEGKTAGHMAAPPSDSLGSAVEHHLRSYFAAHEDGLPASGLYDRILREVAAADRAVAGGHAGQPDPRPQAAGREPHNPTEQQQKSA